MEFEKLNINSTKEDIISALLELVFDNIGRPKVCNDVTNSLETLIKTVDATKNKDLIGDASDAVEAAVEAYVKYTFIQGYKLGARLKLE